MRFYIRADITDFNDEPTETQLALVKDSNTRPDTLRRIYAERGKTDLSVLNALAVNPGTPADILTDIANNCIHYHILANVAVNPNTPREIAQKLLAQPKVRLQVTLTSVLTSDQMISLLEDPSIKFTREEILNIASHENLSQDYREKLIDEYGFRTQFIIDFTSDAYGMSHTVEKAIDIALCSDALANEYYINCWCEFTNEDEVEGEELEGEDDRTFTYCLFIDIKLCISDDVRFHIFSIIENTLADCDCQIYADDSEDW